jgi:hypothetical protein
MVFPLWAVSVGIGAKWALDHPAWRHWPLRGRLTTLGLLVALQGAGLVLYHPCQLSHYSLLTGGLWGAEKLGFEVSYWGDAVTEPLLAEAARRAPEGVVLFGPNLAPFQAPAVGQSSPALITDQVLLVGWDQSWRKPPAWAQYAVIYRRKADAALIPPEVWSAEPLAETQKQGVWLARLVQLTLP